MQSMLQGFEAVQSQLLTTVQQLAEQLAAQQSQLQAQQDQIQQIVEVTSTPPPSSSSAEVHSLAEKFDANQKKLLRALLLLDQRVEALEQ